MVSGVEMVLNYGKKSVPCVVRFSEDGTLEVHIPENSSLVVKVQRDLGNISEFNVKS